MADEGPNEILMNNPRVEGSHLVSMWTVYEIDDGRGIVALVGYEPRVTAFLAELHGYLGIAVNGDPRHIIVAVLGSWPFEKGCDLVRAINQPDSTPRTWARIVQDFVLEDPERVTLSHVEDDLVEELVKSFEKWVERSKTDG